MAQKRTYSMCLQGTNTLGLSIHAIRANYIMQYADSLIGQQLKTLAQVNVFHVYDLVDELGLSLTIVVGELTTLLYFPEIRNLDEYLISQSETKCLSLTEKLIVGCQHCCC
jgi:hypothetical protein